MSCRSPLAILTWILLALPLAAASSAFAQSPAEEPAETETETESSAAPPEDIEAIRVTGKASAGTTQAVPEAITSFDQQQLDVMGIANVDTLALNTPALHVGQFGAKSMITLRGVGVENITEVGDPSVGFEIDGIHMGRPLLPTFFDVERVDVLRGPQATNGGRQTNGGRIALSSKRPDEQTDAFGDFQYGSYDQFLTRAGFNIPILDEKLMTRTTIVHEKRDGYQEFRFTGRNSDNNDDANTLMTRVQARSLLADDTVELWGVANYAHQKGNGSARSLLSKPSVYASSYLFAGTPYVQGAYDPSQFFVACPPGAVQPTTGVTPAQVCTTEEPRETYSDEPSEQNNWQSGFTGHVSWDLPLFEGSRFFSDLRAKLVGGYYDTSQSESFDVDQTNAPNSYFDRDTGAQQGSIEAFIERPDVENFDFKAGLYYFHETVDTHFCFDANGTGQNTDLEADQKLLNESFAGYANAGYRLLDNLKLKGGLRYSIEQKEADQVNTRFTQQFQTPPPLPDGSPRPRYPLTSGCGMKYRDLFKWTGNPNVNFSQNVYKHTDTNLTDDEWSDLLPSAGFDWQITDSNSLAFNFSSSFKAGGFPLGFDPVLANASLKQSYPAEEVKNYELSLKNELLENKLQLNFAAFWTDYDPFQICQLSGPTFFCEGDGSATSRGIEVEVVSNPSENLTINGHFNFLDAKVDRFAIVNPAQGDANGFGIPNPLPVDVSGNALPKAPTLAGSLGVQYALDLERWGILTPRIQAQAQSRTYFRVFNSPDFSQDPFVKFDVSLDWQDEDSRFTVRAFVNNVTDQDVLTFLFVGSQSLGGTVSGQYMPPRTLGLRVGVNYMSDWF